MSSYRLLRSHTHGHITIVDVMWNGTCKSFVIGPHWWGPLITVFVVLFGAYSNWAVINRIQSPSVRLVLQAFVVVCYTIVNVLLFMTASSDSGIVYPSKDGDIESESTPALSDSESGGYGHGNNYCDICNIEQIRQLRVRHCDTCGVCIEGLDHHCPWMVSLVC